MMIHVRYCRWRHCGVKAQPEYLINSRSSQGSDIDSLAEALPLLNLIIRKGLRMQRIHRNRESVRDSQV